MFKKSVNDSFWNSLFKGVERRIETSLSASPKEFQDAVEQIKDDVEVLVTEKLEAKILENRRKTLDKTLEEAENQQKYTPY